MCRRGRIAPHFAELHLERTQRNARRLQRRGARFGLLRQRLDARAVARELRLGYRARARARCTRAARFARELLERRTEPRLAARRSRQLRAKLLVLARARGIARRKGRFERLCPLDHLCDRLAVLQLARRGDGLHRARHLLRAVQVLDVLRLRNQSDLCRGRRLLLRARRRRREVRAQQLHRGVLGVELLARARERVDDLALRRALRREERALPLKRCRLRRATLRKCGSARCLEALRLLRVAARGGRRAGGGAAGDSAAR